MSLHVTVSAHLLRNEPILIVFLYQKGRYLANMAMRQMAQILYHSI
jgi:hypothetical protein